MELLSISILWPRPAFWSRDIIMYFHNLVTQISSQCCNPTCLFNLRKWLFSKIYLHIPCLTPATCLNHQSPVFQSASSTRTPMWDYLIILFQLQMLYSIKWDNKTIINYEYLESLLIYQKMQLEKLRNLDQDSQKHSCNSNQVLTHLQKLLAARHLFALVLLTIVMVVKCTKFKRK
jgi:hypothetical protein